MKQIILLFLILSTTHAIASSSMRRCTLLPITDSVEGAIGFKVFEQVEQQLKRSNWCTYVSNSGLVSIFTKYRENLPMHLKQKEVLATVASKLQVGSLIRVSIVNEVQGVEVTTDVIGENGDDLYFTEKIQLQKDDIDIISQTILNWLSLYAKTIPYDAKINGILGEQLTLDVGKGYPINVGQKFVVKRPIRSKKHPLLKKIVDWDTETLAEGTVTDISDNQALGLVKVYKQDKKLSAGDWVRLEEEKQAVIEDRNPDKKEIQTPGVLGVLSIALFGSGSSVDTTTATGSQRLAGNIFGIDVRGEGWITRHYFAALELARSLGNMSKSSGNPQKSSVNTNNSVIKLTGGYKYLPVGFFYGPQIDIYGGYARHTYDLDFSAADGWGTQTFSGLLAGVKGDIPLNRDYRVFVRGEFLPFPTFTDDDGTFDSADSVSALEFEAGIKYQWSVRMTLDGSFQAQSRKAKFSGANKEISYRDNILKFGASFNF